MAVRSSPTRNGATETNCSVEVLSFAVVRAVRPQVVSSSTGSVQPSARSRRSTSRPPMPGKRTSSTSRSKAPRRARP